MKTKKEKTEKQDKIRRPRKSGPEGGLGHTLYVFFLIFIGSVASVCLCYGLAVSCTQLSDRSRDPEGSETHKQTESSENSDSYETLYYENETEKPKNADPDKNTKQLEIRDYAPIRDSVPGPISGVEISLIGTGKPTEEDTES